MDADQGGENRFGWTIREPRGVIVAISPFNFPLNLVSHKVAPALAGGERRRAQAGLLDAAHGAAAGRAARPRPVCPSGVLQVVVGPGAPWARRWSRTSG